MLKQKLIVICGPTASGKTALAVDVARAFNGEVVSADSMQVYRGMDIGTAKPTQQERGGVPHYLIDCVDPEEEYGAAVYREQARACIADIASRGKLPILCGGTGLYISATIYPLDFSQAYPDVRFRQEMLDYAGRYGNEALHALLKQADPGMAATIHPNNVRRVIRALERTTRVMQDTQGKELFNAQPLYELAWVGLTMERPALYRRIDERVDTMMRLGLLDEVKRLAGALGSGTTAPQALGYKELLEYINGTSALADAVERIKKRTRNYAKRQITWFRRENAIRWFDTTQNPDREGLLRDVSGYIWSALHIS